LAEVGVQLLVGVAEVGFQVLVGALDMLGGSV